MSNYVEQVVVAESPKNNSGGNNFFYVPKVTPNTAGIAKFNKTQFNVSNEGNVSLVDNFSDNVVQTTGDSETQVMSQKAVTDLMLERMPKLNILTCDDYITIDTVGNTEFPNGFITFPATTEFLTGNFTKNLDSDVTVSLVPFTDSSGTYILYNKISNTFEAFPLHAISFGYLNTMEYYYVCSIRRGYVGYGWKPSCDLSVPHYLNGRLFGCGIPTDLMETLHLGIAYDYVSIDTVNGTLTIPAHTELICGAFEKETSEDIVVPLWELQATSGNVILFNKATETFENIEPYLFYTIDTANYYYVCFVRRGGAGLNFKTHADLGAPYYVDGVLMGGASDDSEELEKTIPTTFCPMSPPYSFTGHPFPSIDSTTKIVTFKEGTSMVDSRLPYYGSWEISANYHTKCLTCDMSSVTGTSGIRVCYNISSNQFVARGAIEDIDWSDNLLLLCYNTNSKAAFSSVPVIVDGKLYNANSPIEWSNNSSTSQTYANLSYCALVPSDDFIGHPFPFIDSATKIVTFDKGMSVIDPRLPYKGTGSFGYHVPETCDMSEVTSSSSVCVYYNISTKTLIPKAYNTEVDWNDNLLVLSYNTKTKTAVSSMPVVVDGKLYCASDALTLDFGDKEDPIDNTKPKEFAELFYNKDRVEPFIFFTDPHLCQFEGDGWRTEFDSYMSTLKRFYDESAVTRVFCGGDWLGGGIANAKDACYRLGLADAKMREYFKEYYSIRGNHEANFEYSNNNAILNRATIKNLMFRKEGKTYYIVDGDNSKFFVFDTQDEPSALYDTAYDAEQRTWFAESLKNNTAENILMMAHRFYTGTVSDASLLGFTNQILLIAQAFNNRTSITVNGTGYDFARASGKVRCLLAGHSHTDHTTNLNSIPVVLTTHFRDGSTPTFDMCLADYDNNKLHLVRVGTGSNRIINI